MALADEAWAWLQREIKDKPTRPTPELAYRLAAVRCWMRAEAGPLHGYIEAAQTALELAPPAPDPARCMWLSALRATAAPQHADAMMPEFWDCVRDPALPLRQHVEGLILALGGRLMHGDLTGFDRAARELQQLVELLPHPDRVGRLGQRLTAYVATALCAPVTLAVIRGQLAHARSLLDHVVVEAKRRGLASSRRGDNNAFYMLNQLYAYRGRSAELEPLVDNALREHPGQRWFSSLLKAQFAIERGDIRAAAALYAPLRATAFRPQLDGREVPIKPETLVRLADVCVAVGDAADAEILYTALLPRAPFCIQDGALIGWGACARPLGELARLMGRQLAAEAHLEQAIAHNRRFGHVPETLRSQLALARLQLENNRSAAARALLSQVASQAKDIGMQRLADAATSEAAGG